MYRDSQTSPSKDQIFMYEYTRHSLPHRLNESWAGRRLVEALSHLPPNILSSSLDTKFQRNQMMEREQKKLALAGKEISEGSKNAISNGKVRQMFDDRRRGVGIDKSHPLRPIMGSTASIPATIRSAVQEPSIKKCLENVTKRTALSTTSSTQRTISTRGGVNSKNPISNGNNVFRNNFDKVDNIDNETFPNEFSLLNLSSTNLSESNIVNDPDLDNNNNIDDNISDSSFVLDKMTASKSNGIKLNPVITKKSPTITSTGKQKSRTLNNGNRVSALSKTSSTFTDSAPSKPVLSSITTKNIKTAVKKTTNSKPATFISSVKPPPRISTPPPGMASCQYCHRNFIEERLLKHQEVCRKIMSKKRKIFDASKHRVKGTEAEKYLKKGKVLHSTISKSISAAATNAVQEAKNTSIKKNNWRKKHEDFLAAIREAKKVQAHLAKGGKLSDLPPPPPSENPDYIQCPHCNRRFNEAAAERHIPKCANMQHNKPKPSKKR